MTDYQGYCAFCKHYNGKLVGQCKHHLTFVHRSETCEEGELPWESVRHLIMGGTLTARS